MPLAAAIGGLYGRPLCLSTSESDKSDIFAQTVEKPGLGTPPEGRVTSSQMASAYPVRKALGRIKRSFAAFLSDSTSPARLDLPRRARKRSAAGEALRDNP